MNNAMYASELSKVKNSAAGLVIKLHQSGFKFDFAIQDSYLRCVQTDKLYNYNYVEIDYQSEYYDEANYAFKFIYTVRTQTGIRGILIAQKDHLEKINGFTDRQRISPDLFNGLDPVTYNYVLSIIIKRRRGDGRLMVRFRDKTIAISFLEVAFFYLENDLTRLVMFDGRSYIIQKTMEDLERECGISFFRVNRQYIVNKFAIKELAVCDNRIISIILILDLPHIMTVSKNKACRFMEWFALNI